MEVLDIFPKIRYFGSRHIGHRRCHGNGYVELCGLFILELTYASREFQDKKIRNETGGEGAREEEADATTDEKRFCFLEDTGA